MPNYRPQTSGLKPWRARGRDQNRSVYLGNYKYEHEAYLAELEFNRAKLLRRLRDIDDEITRVRKGQEKTLQIAGQGRLW